MRPVPTVRPALAGRTWRRFRAWRRSRPFWGGLLLTLSAVEIFLTTQLSLGGLTFQMGPTGFLSWLIPTILLACGLLSWFTPAQHLFYAVVGAVTAVFSLIGVNLGGFFVGLILGIVGSGLVFAWTPAPATAPTTAIPAQPGPHDSADADTAEVPTAAEGLVPDLDDPANDQPPRDPARPATPPADVAPSDVARSGTAPSDVARAGSAQPESAGPGMSATDAWRSRAAQPEVAGPPTDSGQPDSTHVGLAPPDPEGDAEAAKGSSPLPRRSDPRFYSVVAFLLVLGMSAVVAAQAGTPAYAAPCPKPPAASKTEAGRTASPAPAPTPTPTPQERRRRGILGGIIDGITGIFDGDSDEEQESAAVPSPAPTTIPTPPPAAGTPKASDCAGSPAAGAAQTAKPAVPMLAPDPDVPDVNSKPSVLTGTKLTMWGLRLEGIYVLHTAAGDVRSLKFTMSRSLVRTFALRVPQGAGPSLFIKSDTLTVRGDVAFYTSRFVGRIAGIKLTLTPDSPLPPDGIPLTIPRIDFDDPRIDLMYVSCDQLLAPTLDESFVSAST